MFSSSPNVAVSVFLQQFEKAGLKGSFYCKTKTKKKNQPKNPPKNKLDTLRIKQSYLESRKARFERQVYYVTYSLN